ncbi:hypothetical protein H6F86_20820 [Phormidium sp. FACHB-592]|uniref:Uncharacterized protein n=1 Tax=Stenomitos frigidus AS-A4 TaxID=2933935 RepID=A0ABV0KEK8_9CYAN|nr:hypothetical protein [Phormidium sp. FACHB-592]MBD2076277.1 hypothetical protein [Phormidium sp. FACHB-592]
MKKHQTVRTHLSAYEVGNAVREKYPTISATVIAAVKEQHNIWGVKAGADVLYPIAQVEKLLEAIAQIELIERNGFLVLPDSFHRM